MFNTENQIFSNRPTNIISEAFVLNRFERHINTMNLILNETINRMFTNMDEMNSSSKYASTISTIYPILVNLHKYSEIFADYNMKFIERNVDACKYIKDVIKNFRNESLDIIDILKEFKLFNLSTLERYINIINGNIFILYYTSATYDQMKIPKFIYHTLGNKPLIIFDNQFDNINLINPLSNSNDYDTETINLDQIKGKNDRSIGLYKNDRI
jgi:hypothetical protein